MDLEEALNVQIHLSGGHSASNQLRMVQLVLGLHAAKCLKVAVQAGSGGWLHLLSDDEQATLMMLENPELTGPQQKENGSASLLLRCGEALGSRGGLNQTVVLVGQAQKAHQAELARFGQCFVFGSMRKCWTAQCLPWPVEDTFFSRQVKPDANGTVVVLSDDFAADRFFLTQQLHTWPQPIFCLDPNQAWQRAEKLDFPKNIRWLHAAPVAQRSEVYAQCRWIAMRDPALFAEDLFVHEATAMGLVPSQSSWAMPNVGKISDIVRPICLHLLGKTKKEQEVAQAEAFLVGHNRAIITTNKAALADTWQSVQGAEITLALVGPRADTDGFYGQLVGQQACCDVLINAAVDAGQVAQLLGGALAGQLAGRIDKVPKIRLFEHVAGLACELRAVLAEGQGRLVLIHAQGGSAAVKNFWHQQINAVADNYCAGQREAEPRLVVQGIAGSGAWDGGDHRLGAHVASADVSHALQIASIGRLRIQQGLFGGSGGRGDRVYLAGTHASTLTRDQLVGTALWPQALIRQALQYDLIDAMLSTSGPLLFAAQSDRLLWAGKALPLIGVLHSLHAPSLIADQVMHWLSGAVMPYDALVSPSACGRTALLGLFEPLAAWLHERGLAQRPTMPEVTVIPYGIDEHLFGGRSQHGSRINLGLPTTGLLFVSLMRFDRFNKADLAPLVLAFARLIDRGVDGHLVLGGAAQGRTELDRLETLATNLGVGERVHLRCDLLVDEKAQLLAAADVFVALSDNVQETYGLGVLEAMASGLPVVAAAWNGYKELVDEGETGLLVPTLWHVMPVDKEQMASIDAGLRGYACQADLSDTVAVDIDLLMHALHTMALNEEGRRRMGAAGRDKVVHQYSLKRQGQVLVDFICERIALARQSSAPRPKGRPFVDHLSRRFAHYASEELAPQAYIAATKAAQNEQERRAIMTAMAIEDPAEEEVLLRFLKRLKTSAMPLSSLITQNFDHARLMRALKYGLIKQAAPPKG